MKTVSVHRFILSLYILLGCIPAIATNVNSNASLRGTEKQETDIPVDIKSAKSAELERMNSKLSILLATFQQNKSNKKLAAQIEVLIDTITKRIEVPETDSLLKSDAFYLKAVYLLLSGDNKRALENLTVSRQIREKINVADKRYGNILYNIAISCRNLGDLYTAVEVNIESLNFYRKYYGESSYHLIDSYSGLISAYIELQENDKALYYSNIALAISDRYADSIPAMSIASIYDNLGVCYNRMADFSKAKLYLEKSEYIHKLNSSISDITYINLINSLAITYGALGLKEKSTEYYRKGVSLAISSQENSSYTYNIIYSYALSLANSGNTKDGNELLKNLIKKLENARAENSQLYFEVICNYADFLREFNIDNSKSQILYSSCLDYLKKHPENIYLNSRVNIGYSLSLSKNGEPEAAMNNLQKIITQEYKTIKESDVYINPSINEIKIDRVSLRLFKAKYTILWDIYRKTNKTESLIAAASTSELIVGLLEKIRINISEEESRLILGDKYRELYLNSIRDYNLLFKKTLDNKYLKKAFEYSEKSKVAGLLASTRELKASQFQIPSELAKLELKYMRNLGELNAMISEESNKNIINEDLIRRLNERVLTTTIARDSLILVFEKQFPGYYSIKYNTNVVHIENIPEIVGRNGNYINYILSDTLLYIFVANRTYNHLTSIRVDSLFISNIKAFRKLLSIPAPSDDAAAAFTEFQKTGYYLYRILIEQIRPYLISDKVIISPDNILSYIPFETLPSNEQIHAKPWYRSVHYLMQDFDISYTYSATFLAESIKGSVSFSNSLVAFAPNYTEPIDVKSILMSRQEEQGILRDLPYARQEAEYVSDLMGGSIYENSKAKESVFKNESGKFDIVHLAMHTLLNDKDPMRSTLIFSPESDTLNDGYLKTFEVYGLPLVAKMVVLSSCNTGTGFLSTGEGILSLARGFIYSGSKSVVMSMWEIEDRSGTEIVKKFYKNLKYGYSKSESLRRARIEYLNNSDQLRSHPYFWSALVIYGNNNPLYYPRYLKWILYGAVIILSLFITLYFWKRKYS